MESLLALVFVNNKKSLVSLLFTDFVERMLNVKINYFGGTKHIM